MTFSMDREASMRTYSDLGISEAFHPLSHHGNMPDKQAKLVQIQTYHTDVFSAFVKRLAGQSIQIQNALRHLTCARDEA